MSPQGPQFAEATPNQADTQQAPPPLRSAFSPALWQRLTDLDAHFAAATQARGTLDPAASGPWPSALSNEANAFDVALVGGGLHVVLAPLLAQRGLRVAVIERTRAGAAHREWNASAAELQALVASGFCSAAELEKLVVARYTSGTCAWHNGGSYAVQGVLDCAVDAQALLQLARARAQAAGVVFFDATQLVRERGDAGGVSLELRAVASCDAAQTSRFLRVGALVDARGATSPYNRADLVCPTVGGVLEGLQKGTARDCIDPAVGEILATTEGVEEGRQHIWEAFPTHPGQTAIYLFYYCQRQALPQAALARLYTRFCATLPRFKRGPWRLVRPTFGLIPGWSRMTPANTSPHARIVLVGDAASRHSPLTFCGFGAMLRSLLISVASVQAACRGESGRTALAVDDRPLHQVTGALATLLASPPPGSDPQRLNRLLDHAFATLASLGNDTFRDLLQDTLPTSQALRFLWQTSRRYPQVWRDVQQGLGLRRATAWAWHTARAAAQGK